MPKRSNTAIATEREGLMECHYKEEDWVTTRVTKKSTWSKGKDMFGIGDILGFRRGVTRITDVTSYNILGKIEIMKEWMLKHFDDTPDDLECEVAVWKPKGKNKPERFLMTKINAHMEVEKYEIEIKPEWYDILKEER